MAKIPLNEIGDDYETRQLSLEEIITQVEGMLRVSLRACCKVVAADRIPTRKVTTVRIECVRHDAASFDIPDGSSPSDIDRLIPGKTARKQGQASI